MTERFVLDASALLNILLDEPGRDRVNQIVDGCRIHAVNLAEVLGRLVSGGMPPGKAASALADLYLALNEGFGGRSRIVVSRLRLSPDRGALGRGGSHRRSPMEETRWRSRNECDHPR